MAVLTPKKIAQKPGWCGRKNLQRGTIFQRKLEEAVATGEFQLGANVRAVGFHGARADEEFRADFLAVFFLGHELEDTALSLGQVIEAGLLRFERFRTVAAADKKTRNGRT